MDIIHGIKHTNSEQFVIFVIRSRSGEPEEITRQHGGKVNRERSLFIQSDSTHRHNFCKQSVAL